MARYKLTNKAVEDLTQIWNYTFNKWSENQADTSFFTERWKKMWWKSQEFYMSKWI
jgi:hypothetical protein